VRLQDGLKGSIPGLSTNIRRHRTCHLSPHHNGALRSLSKHRDYITNIGVVEGHTQACTVARM
jgi:hypothetical protein